MKATEKASERALVPSNAAFVISRRRPSTRDTRVSSDSADPERSRERGERGGGALEGKGWAEDAGVVGGMG
jgi:hypothetical protein